MRPLTAFVLMALGPQRSAWRGEAPLGEVFWLQGVCVTLTLAAAFAAAFVAGDVPAAQALLLLLTGYTGWVLVAIWRCAQSDAAGPFGALAQALTIAWALNTLLVAVSLALAIG